MATLVLKEMSCCSAKDLIVRIRLAYVSMSLCSLICKIGKLIPKWFYLKLSKALLLIDLCPFVLCESHKEELWAVAGFS